MTDINSIIKALSVLLGTDEEDAAKHSNIINSTAACVKALIKDEVDDNDSRMIHLCAVKAYYQIVLVQEDEISSFSAGDVSYSKNTSAVDKAEKLLKAALNDCGDLLKNTGFAFKVV